MSWQSLVTLIQSLITFLWAKPWGVEYENSEGDQLVERAKKENKRCEIQSLENYKEEIYQMQSQTTS